MKSAPKRLSQDRVTYRELRNTPGQVWERLANNEPLTLIADGEAKALLLPVIDGDVGAVYEAFIRGRAMLAASRMRRQAREAGSDRLTLAEINALIRKTRAARPAEERPLPARRRSPRRK
jgi:hypothetical protein